MAAQPVFDCTWKVSIYRVARQYSSKPGGNMRMLNPNPSRLSFEIGTKRTQPSRPTPSSIQADDAYKQELLKAGLWWGYHSRYHCKTELYEYLKIPGIERLEIPHRDGKLINISQLHNRIKTKRKLKWPLTLMERYVEQFGKDLVNGKVPNKVQLTSRISRIVPRSTRRFLTSKSSVQEIETLIGPSRLIPTSNELLRLQDLESKTARDFACLRTERAFGMTKR